MIRCRPSTRAFTLIELLVVVAIIALLISILLPSLSRARQQAKTVKCGANLATAAKAVQIYLAESRGTFPLSYFYASSKDGGQDLNKQNKGFGYYHWSYFLFGKGEVGDDAFRCPEMEDGGHPRTYPGNDLGNWEVGEQVDGSGTGPPNDGAPNIVTDWQATRMAFTGNAAILGRNKLGNVSAPSPGLRTNKFARETTIDEAGRTILLTEFVSNWRLVATGNDGSLESKAHRPVNPFHNEASSFNEYGLPPNLGIYRYWPSATDPLYGLQSLKTIEESGGWADDSSTLSEMNFVGRHHPGGDKLGGTANFAFVDGHVERQTILQSLVEREWGKKYHAITGNGSLSTVGYEFMPK